MKMQRKCSDLFSVYKIFRMPPASLAIGSDLSVTLRSPTILMHRALGVLITVLLMSLSSFPS